MIILYTRVYCETQKRQKELGRLQASNVSISSLSPELPRGDENG